MPLGEGFISKEIFKKSMLYLWSVIIAGAISGFIYVTIIYLISYWLPTLIKIFIMLGLVLLYAFHEFKLIKLPIIQRHWQIPSSWVKHPYWSMLVWGGILGPGIFTYIPHSTFYFLYLYIGFFKTPEYGVVFGAVYGISRVVPSVIFSIYRSLFNKNLSIELNNMLTIKKINHYINGTVLIFLAIFLIHLLNTLN